LDKGNKMKYDATPIETDIRAALRIGKEESIWVALEGLLLFPEVLGNNEMEMVFLRKIILPVGLLLRHPNLSTHLLEEMQKHPQAAVRALAGVSVVDNFFHQNISKQSLLKSSNDGRMEVKICVALAISKLANQFPVEHKRLIDEFIVSPVDNVKYVALQSLGLMSVLSNPDIVDVINGIVIPSDPALKAGLRDCLVNFANLGYSDLVLSYLVNAVEKTGATNIQDLNWVVGKTLGRSWVVNRLENTFSLITLLAEKSSEHKQLLNTLQSISRHAGTDVVVDYINSFPESKSDNMAEFLFAANKILSK
jgi:hypothetical protein